MVNIESYISRLTEYLKAQFGQRILYVGLQGSYLRGEATDSSDIDIMVILDELNVSDLDAYRGIIQSLEDYDKSCGFICGRDDLLNWNPMEIRNLLGSTKDYFGKLSDFVPSYSREDLRNFVKMSLNNLYHELCHRYIHADARKNAAALPGTYKGVFFILQNLHCLRTGEFVGTKAELRQTLEGRDKAVLERAMAMKQGDYFDFADSYALLFDWCRDALQTI
ncbi:MAG: nucleotidyltransferase domain-containing protein [Oscillospiraceae bacterium]|nr:nucleotidyltransferase domain-containing protein [Oscillospiraceae bacterium]